LGFVFGDPTTHHQPGELRSTSLSHRPRCREIRHPQRAEPGDV